MGQSGALDVKNAPATHRCASIFPTALGWMGIAGEGDAVAWLTLGHASADDARAALETSAGPFEERDWHPVLRDRLERYASGEKVAFTDIRIDIPEATPFRKRVLDLTRKLPYGAVVSYGELAALAGKAGAARAVGTAMSTNRLPLIIPCHRVVGSGGGLGGYSAPQGLSLKQRLLDMERQTEAAVQPLRPLRFRGRTGTNARKSRTPTK